MSTFLKQSTAITAVLGPFLDSTDGDTEEAALASTLSASISASKAGGILAARSSTGTCAYASAGWYQVPLDTTDTNTVGQYILYAHPSGALATWREFVILPANSYDSLVGGTDSLNVEATGSVAVSSIAGGVQVGLSGSNTVGISGASNVTLTGSNTVGVSSLTTTVGVSSVSNTVGVSSINAGIKIELSGANTVGVSSLTTTVGISSISAGLKVELSGSNTVGVSSLTTTVGISSNTDKAGYGLSADQSNIAISAVTAVLSAFTHTGAVIPSAAVAVALGTQAKADVEAEVGDALNVAFDDSTGLNAGSVKDRLRTNQWILRNKMDVTDATGTAQLYKDDNITAAISGTVTDDATTTTRTRLA